MIEITKLKAAERQINCAVRMFFNSEDSIAVHTLVGAAMNIFYDLSENLLKESSWEAKISEDNGLSKRDFLKKVRKYQNFFKHADKDPGSGIGFNMNETEELIFISRLNWGNLHSNKQSLSVELSVFQIWYIAVHQLNKKFDSRLIDAADEIFPAFKYLSREEKLLKGKEYLIKLR